MAEKPTKEERAGKGPRVDLDQLDATLATRPPADTAQPVHTEEEDEPATVRRRTCSTASLH
jgi:hypothetical protein